MANRYCVTCLSWIFICFNTFLKIINLIYNHCHCYCNNPSLFYILCLFQECCIELKIFLFVETHRTYCHYKFLVADTQRTCLPNAVHSIYHPHLIAPLLTNTTMYDWETPLHFSLMSYAYYQGLKLL